MGLPQRLVLAALIVVIDAVVFFLPLGALFLAYVIVTNPPWVREFLNRLGRPQARN
jgi:hypothetical protein